MNLLKRIYKLNISSDKMSRQILGAMARHWVLTLFCILSIIAGIFKIVAILFPNDTFCQLWNEFTAPPISKWLALISLTILLVTLIRICNTLTDINNLLQKENRITWCQILILIGIGLWLLGVIFILGIQKEQKSVLGFGLIK